MGLKQGCILSPILFAIYIAHLPEFLKRWGKGILLEDVFVSILLFADDLVILSDSEFDFKNLLLGLGEYANMWHLEVSQKKSVVMVYGEKFVPQRLWSLGNHQVQENVYKEITIKEVECVKYLGLSISRNNDIFRVYKQGISEKGRSLKWLCTVPAERLMKRVWFGSYLWRCYVLPTLLYGTDAVTTN